MKNQLLKKTPKLELKNGTYEGGFSTLSSDQLTKLKGGTHSNCTNSGDCTKGENQICTNSGTCFTNASGGSVSF